MESKQYRFSVDEILELSKPRIFFSDKWDKKGKNVIDFLVDDVTKYVDINYQIKTENLTVNVLDDTIQTKFTYNVSVKVIRQFYMNLTATTHLIPVKKEKNEDALI